MSFTPCQLRKPVLAPQHHAGLPIFSLRFRSDKAELHFGFVVRLLNDRFGIQARGGCSCAGPYGHSLLGLTRENSEALASQVPLQFGCLRPGWVRFNLDWLCTDEEVDYLLNAMLLIAKWGARLLASRALDRESGLWRHRDTSDMAPAKLDAFAFMQHTTEPAVSATPATAGELLAAAEKQLRSGAPKAHQRQADNYFQHTPWPDKAETLCWFLRPHEGQ